MGTFTLWRTWRTHDKVKGQIVIYIVISVNLFQIAPVRTGSLQLQPNLVHRYTMGTFSLWRSSRSHDKVKGHWRPFSNFVWTRSLQLQPNLDHRYTKVHNGNLHVMMLFEVTWQGQRSLEVKLLVIWRQIVIVMVALFQIAPAWTGLHWLQPNVDHRCTQRSLEVKLLVIWRQIVIVMVALFQIAPAWTGSLRLQPNLNHRCTMGTFTLWRTSRSHDKVKCHFRSTSLKLVSIFCVRSFLLWYCKHVTF